MELHTVSELSSCGLMYMGVSSNGATPIAGWFRIQDTNKMDDLGVPLFQETSI